ncbi:MAG: HPP family protein [bacterium]
MTEKQYTVSDFMHKEVPTVFPWDTIKKTYDTLMDHKLRALPVISGEKELVGIISERDIVRYRTLNILPKHAEFYINVSDVMTREVNVFDPGTTLRQACQRFVETNNNQFPVVKDDRVLGMVKQSDLLKFFAENWDELLKNG